MLESVQHVDNAFVTLTYDDEHLPENSSLEPRHVQLFLKKVRKAVQPARLRFFCVGEYGDRTERPHYHVALHGYPTCDRGQTDLTKRYCCDPCDILQRLWDHGGVFLARLEPDAASYIAGYVVKKLTNSKDETVADILGTRHPEFARMSLRPGIGAEICDDIASTVLTHTNAGPGDVPAVLTHGVLRRPLGRYLRNRIRERIGVSKEDFTALNLAKIEAELHPLREATKDAPTGFKSFAFQQAIIESGVQKRRNLDARMRRNRKRSL